MDERNDTRTPLERVMEIIPWDDLTIPFSKATARRVACYMERYNAEVRASIAIGGAATEEDLMDPGKPDDVRTAVGSLLEQGLEANEAKHGLVGLLDGRVIEDTPEYRAGVAARMERFRREQEEASGDA